MESFATYRYLVENDFDFQGFRCIVTGVSAGYRCGFIAIPEGHRLFGIHHDQMINIDVYGGWTYSGLSSRYPVSTEAPTWWIGFDCGHSGESRDFQLMQELGEAEKVSIMRKGMGFDENSVKSVGFVINELKSAVRKIIALN